MVHFAVFSLLFIVAIAITAVMFVFWLILVVVRGVARLFLGPGLKQPRKIAQRDPPHTRRCPQGTCKAMNPAEARFCKRCGRRMDEPQRAPVRRVAML
jgi:hypothetical protein